MNRAEQQKLLQQALSPKSIKLDERSEMDLLSFVAQYSDLILYYDSHNNQQGSWRDFFLKAPQILLAAISKTNYQLPLRQFNALVRPNIEISATLNPLCDLIKALFLDLNDWLVQMEKDHREYSLKSYLQQQIRSTLSQALWQFVDIQKNQSAAQQGVEAPDLSLYQSFEPLWHAPIQQPCQSALDSVTELQLIFKTLFSVYVNVIDNAQHAYNTLKSEINNHPDSALLISFVRLLKTHQTQLNTITEKHLNFYYRDILQQTELQQAADQVYLSIALAEQIKAHTLVKGVAFKAGVDSQNKPIIFANLHEKQLNHAKIKQIIKVNYQKNKHQKNLLYISQPESIAEIKQDKDGRVLCWPLFEPTQSRCHQQKYSLAIASPMFYLQEGDREIKLAFHFSKEVDNNPFRAANYYLTCADGWLDISEQVTNSVNQKGQLARKIGQQIILSIKLDEAITAICQCEEIDDIQSPWPLLKIVFSDNIDLQYAPHITKIDIGVEVSGLQHGIALSNEHGLLTTDAPFSPFGPVVNAGAYLDICSTEVFAKPLTSLHLTLDWLNLPNDFAEYYQPYNAYLDEIETGSGRHSHFNNHFHNHCFNICFSYYSQNSWSSITAKASTSDNKKGQYSELVNLFHPLKEGGKKVEEKSEHKGVLNRLWDNAFTSEEELKSIYSGPRSEQDNTMIDSHEGGNIEDKRTLAAVSSFELSSDNIASYPSLLINNQQLSYSTHANIRIKLQQPMLGFGYALFDKVIAWVSQKNSLLLLKQAQNTFPYVSWGAKDKMPESLPNQPFSPNVKQLALSYRAQASINLINAKNQLPFELYHHDSFSCRAVLDNSNQRGVTELPLFAALNCTNNLYFEVQDLSAPCQLTLYFQLADHHCEKLQDDNSRLRYLYLSSSGWKSLSILSDSTGMLSFSGIIEFNIPTDIDSQSPLMPGNNHWICIACNDEIQASVIYINTQVIKAQRIINKSNISDGPPTLAAGSITSLLTANAVLDSVEQPFSSFNGKGCETSAQFYQRVSYRLANKDRVISTNDYCSIALATDDNLFYCKQLLNQKPGDIHLLLVSGCVDESLSGAFNPKVNTARMAHIKQAISQRCSAFVNLQLQNPIPIKVKVIARIICPLTRQNAVSERVNRALKLFLSPWINGVSQQQIKIDSGLTQSQVMAFIAEQKDVEAVLSVELTYDRASVQSGPLNECALLISAEEHLIETMSSLVTSAQSKVGS